MPSGILWSAIAIVRSNPNLVLFVVVMYVAIPSGILCIIIVNIVIIPNLYSFKLFLECLSTLWSMIFDINTPINMLININKTVLILLWLLKISLNEFGIKSIMETLSITPDANPNDLLITLFLFVFININKNPIIVDIPAIQDKIKAYVLLDILSPIYYMLLFIYYILQLYRYLSF